MHPRKGRLFLAEKQIKRGKSQVSYISPSSKSVIDKVASFAKQKLKSSEAELVVKFIRLYYGGSSHDDLCQHTIANLFGAAYSHWKLMDQAEITEAVVKVFNPELKKDGWESAHSIIQVVVPDSPFIVDSMRMLVNRLGFTTYLVTHLGGVEIKRDKFGRIVEVSANKESPKDGMIEAPIYMEISRQTNPKVLKQIQDELVATLKDVRIAVKDWAPMRARMQEVLDKLSKTNKSLPKADVEESTAFLAWALDNHFTFLGARDYRLVGKGEKLALELIAGSGLGVLRDESTSKVVRLYTDLAKEAREMALSKEQSLIISKTNTRSTVHRPAYTDYIGVKIFNDKGDLVEERRFIGLFTSTAYSCDPREIPFIRQKVASVLKKSGLPSRSYAGKDLLHILMTLPRNDLFHSTTEQLYDLSVAIMQMQDRDQVRLFVRPDPYGRYYSCYVYLPRENFTTDVALRMEKVLAEAFHATEVMTNTWFSESVLARIHYVLRVNPKEKIRYDLAKIEQSISEIGRSWTDVFDSLLWLQFGEEKGSLLAQRYKNTFPVSYCVAFSPQEATNDLLKIEKLSADNNLEMMVYSPVDAPAGVIRFKLYRRKQTIPLSDVIPMLENMGLRVIDEKPYELTLDNDLKVWINDFGMSYLADSAFSLEELSGVFQEAFSKVWNNEVENDRFNGLVLKEKLNAREVSLLRAYAKYSTQAGFIFSQSYIEQALLHNPAITRLLVELFKVLFDPAFVKKSKAAALHLKERIYVALDNVSSLDEDRILRYYLSLIDATLRTNYFQLSSQLSTNGCSHKPYISFKFDPKKIPDLRLPLPKYEVFVYAPRFEGIHLRAAKVARGGIRWSDRREDFRVEVLGLMKAQQVKNAVIVPAGAKGGFVTKQLSTDLGRDAILQEGIECYKGFINGLLDLTDNIVQSQIVKPLNTVCYDEDDPYLVVAADKGTATFSDIANSISLEHKFWLGDAFASGGSAGYDHKKMGITAKGAWVSAVRHFQDLGLDLNKTEITVSGIGDLSGDVFGNGMLLSKHLKLVAAFNHMHIFLDPTPDPKISFKERKRIFDLPRSTWTDYNPALISPGGGIYSRSLKAIKITEPVKKALGITQDSLTPNELIQAILRAPVDMLWNGGIGTYVKATTETNADVGDRSSDALRINGCELRAKVVCEGGNLGLTQLGRIEYEQQTGGRINTDFIDNSAGVDCSDHEVNIKILLNSIVASGKMTEKDRNSFLVTMTDQVADLVLDDNYIQNRSISLAALTSAKHLPLYQGFIDVQEAAGKINRVIEFLPSNKELQERKLQGKGLTRPELSVLSSYSKIILKGEMLASGLTQDPYLSKFIKYAFPYQIEDRFAKPLKSHYLSQEIIATQLSNRLVSDMGIVFVHRLQDETGASIPDIVRAYTVSANIFSSVALFDEIEKLDHKVDAEVQYKMMEQVVQAIRRSTRWFLRNRIEGVEIESTAKYFTGFIAELYQLLPTLLLGHDKEIYKERRHHLLEHKVPKVLAEQIAASKPMYHALNIIEAAAISKKALPVVAEMYFMIGDRLNLLWLRDRISEAPVDTHWSLLARAALKADLDWILRQLTIAVFNLDSKQKEPSKRLDAWLDKYQKLLMNFQQVLTGIRKEEHPEFTAFSVAIRDLMDLVRVG